MSEVAGKISIQAGAHALEKTQFGRGVLMAGAAGAPPADVVIIGCGVVGFNAALIAVGMGANVSLIDKSKDRLDELKKYFSGKNKWKTIVIDLDKLVAEADLLIGGVLVPGSAAPKLVSEALVSKMRKGSAIVDVAIARVLNKINNIDTALKKYENIRKKRVTAVQKTSIKNGKFFHINNLILRKFFHITMLFITKLHPSFLKSRYNWIYNYKA